VKLPVHLYSLIAPLFFLLVVARLRSLPTIWCWAAFSASQQCRCRPSANLS